MEGLPQELILILIFVAIVLFQLMTRRMGQRAQRESSTPDEGVSEYLEDDVDVREPPEASPVSTLSVGHFGRTEAPMATPALARRRFSRRALMGTRREVQNAVVIAAILGPCRAFEPHDLG